MVNSMTGFGRAGGNVLGREVSIEIRSVNNRYRDILTYLPKAFISLEDWLNERVAEYVRRGRVEVRVKVEGAAAIGQTLKVDLDRAKAYQAALVSLKNSLGLSDEISLAGILGAGNIITWEEEETDLEELKNHLAPILDEALTTMAAMRTREGDSLAQDLLSRLESIGESLKVIESRRDHLVAEAQSRLEEKLLALSERLELDPARLHQEVAYLIERGDISEEITRLRSHFEQFRQFLDDGAEIGRKLDFLLQEFNREINTISSKTRDTSVTNAAVDFKAELEKIREQVQNIE